jgi:hypothetical protein
MRGVDDDVVMDPIPRALRLAAQTRRPQYVLRGEILSERPPLGPFTICWPGGMVEASGVGRKKLKHRRPGGLAETAAQSPDQLAEEGMADDDGADDDGADEEADEDGAEDRELETAEFV